MYKKYFVRMLIFLIVTSIHAQEIVKVTYVENISLRSLAKEYFNNPNDWEIILKYNGYNSLEELKSNTEIEIPAGLYSTIKGQIKSANEAIRLANKEGAGILADDILKESVQSLENAKKKLKNGKLDEARELLNLSITKSREAIKISKDKRIQAIMAILAQKRGSVQTRMPEQVTWIDAVEKQNLKEKQRVRTLSNSSGQIRFIDGSRLSLNENSLAVIEAMKQDIIKKTQTSSVTLIQGDVLAYLSSLSQKSVVNVTTPGVETNIRSREFRTSRDEEKVARFANYDGEIELKASGHSVTLAENEGSSIAPGKPPEPPKKLLAPPQLQSPSEDQTFFEKELTFLWSEIPGAKSYQMQISTNRAFSTVIKSLILTSNSYTWKANDSGVYYWRVCAIDKSKLAGPFTSPSRFYINYDITPPFLIVRTPADQQVVFTRELVINGTTEQGSVLRINNQPVEYSKNGDFSYSLNLDEGRNEIMVSSKDMAGNSSVIRRIVFCNLKEQLIHMETPNPYYINSEKFVIKGSVEPGTEVFINDEPLSIVDNRFTEVFHLPEGKHSIMLNAKTGEGTKQSLELTINVDITPPDIFIGNYSSFTTAEEERISGTISEEAVVSVNDNEIDVSNLRFERSFPLKNGLNTFVIKAVDKAGNSQEKTINIILDDTPPVIGKVELSANSVKGGEVLKAQVTANDVGIGLAKTGLFIVGLSESGVELRGILKYLESKNSFEGSVFIPPGIGGKVELKNLQIKDRLGNMASYPE